MVDIMPALENQITDWKLESSTKLETDSSTKLEAKSSIKLETEYTFPTWQLHLYMGDKPILVIPFVAKKSVRDILEECKEDPYASNVLNNQISYTIQDQRDIIRGNGMSHLAHAYLMSFVPTSDITIQVVEDEPTCILHYEVQNNKLETVFESTYNVALEQTLCYYMDQFPRAYKTMLVTFAATWKYSNLFTKECHMSLQPTFKLSFQTLKQIRQTIIQMWSAKSIHPELVESMLYASQMHLHVVFPEMVLPPMDSNLSYKNFILWQKVIVPWFQAMNQVRRFWFPATVTTYCERNILFGRKADSIVKFAPYFVPETDQLLPYLQTLYDARLFPMLKLEHLVFTYLVDKEQIESLFAHCYPHRETLFSTMRTLFSTCDSSVCTLVDTLSQPCWEQADSLTIPISSPLQYQQALFLLHVSNALCSCCSHSRTIYRYLPIPHTLKSFSARDVLHLNSDVGWNRTEMLQKANWPPHMFENNLQWGLLPIDKELFDVVEVGLFGPCSSPAATKDNARFVLNIECVQ